MLPLTDIATWEKLENPYEDARDIPALLSQLTDSPSADILDKICWEYIFHQNSLYEATFATVPHLINICEKTDDVDYRMGTFINLGVILAELDANGDYLRQIFTHSNLDPQITDTIVKAFKSSFERLKEIGQSLLDAACEMPEEDKRYFLAALATAYERYSVAKMFCVYSENEEYMCTCPACDTEFYLWNRENQLILYTQDPVFHEDQAGFPVTPRSLNTMQAADLHFEWLAGYVDKLSIQSLQTIITYLFGKAQCPECNTSFEVFEAVSEPLG